MHSYLTDPNDPDTDNDGQNDGDEVDLGFNPNNPLSNIFILIIVIIIIIVLISVISYVAMRKIKRKKIEASTNTLIASIEAKIKEGEQFSKKGDLINTEVIFRKQLEEAQAISDTSKREEISKKIREHLKPLQIIKIKNKVKELASKHTRLQVMDIVDSCSEEEGLIISTIQNMIKNREISAEYFNTNKVIAFISEIDVEQIDKLMKTFDDWEKEGKGKKL